MYAISKIILPLRMLFVTIDCTYLFGNRTTYLEQKKKKTKYAREL